MSLIGRFEHLPGRPRSDEARPMLEKIASQVKPIMSKRDWKVGTLAEFLPANPALLGNNMNAGQRINLRLRPPGAESTFYEYDQLVLVMLHELTHIVHGPHNAQFYALLSELEEEFYSLKRKGYEGEGFHGRGNHLSGLRVSEYEGRKKGLLAAQKRLDVQVKIGKGGVLGGANAAGKGKTMREVLAEAAERRARDDKACHAEEGGDGGEVQREVEKARKESVGVDAVDLVDLTGDSDAEEEILPPGTASSPGMESGTRGESTGIKPQSTSTVARFLSATNLALAPTTAGTAPKLAHVVRPRNNQTVQPLPAVWSCPTCTLVNPLSARTCEACTSPRPVDRDAARRAGKWMCEFCGSGPIEMDRWSCTECGWVRNWG